MCLSVCLCNCVCVGISSKSTASTAVTAAWAEAEVEGDVLLLLLLGEGVLVGGTRSVCLRELCYVEHQQKRVTNHALSNSYFTTITITLVN